MKKIVKTNLIFALSFILVLGPNFFSANSLAWADEALGNSLLSQANDAINESSSPDVSGLEEEKVSVSGNVTNNTSEVIKDFAVKLTNKTTSTITYDAKTDANGAYSFNEVQAGTYTLKITKTGYTEITKEDISISSESAKIEAIDVVPLTYTVAFNANGGSGSVNDKTFTYDVAQELSSGKTLTRTDYTLKTWNTKADGSGQSYSLKQSVSNLTTKDGDTVTLYAQWEKSGSGSGGDKGGGSSHKGSGSSDSSAAGSKSKSKSSSSKDKESSDSKSHSSKDKDDSASGEGKSRSSKDSSSNLEEASFDSSNSGKTIANPVVTGVGGVVAGAAVATGAIFLIQFLLRKRKLK